MIKDRLINGAIAGAAGALVQNTYALILAIGGYGGPNYVTYGKLLLGLNNYNGLSSDILGLIGHFVWDMLLGVFFAYIISRTSSRYYLVKGTLYGAVIWYLIKAGSFLFRAPLVTKFSPESIAFYFAGSLLFGLSTAFTMKLLDRSRIKI
ncbi:MAG: hypothetical protein CVU89_15155 [Firmicutes bacterium HGW-Firmicutes-14]|nr:MAG: hypothetical protein CVU89_15155 [Firmicutes bacterium HGW-Firmicutes-14]